MMSRAALVSLAAMIAACGETPTAPKVVPDEALLAPAQSAPGLVVTPANPTILIGQSLTLSVKNANGSAINKTATWKSSDTSIAIVVSTGTSTAQVTGRRAGTVTITAVSSNKSGTTTTTVVPVPVRSVTLSPDSSVVELYDVLQYTATPRDSAGNPLLRVINWSVENFGVATINNNGLATSNGRGTTRVIATVEGVADTAWLTVQQTPARIQVFEKSIIFDALGETKQLIATVYDKKDYLITDAVVSWSTSDDTIATVDANGVVTPRATGQSAWTFIAASLGELADSATVTVYRTPTSVVASPDSMLITELTSMGQTSGQFTAVMYDRNGYPINGGWLMWESLESQIVSVGTFDGAIVAHQNGQARIVAISFSGVQDTVLVTVAVPPPEEGFMISDASRGATWDSVVAVLPERRVRPLARRSDSLAVLDSLKSF
jgi:uncharacterized protein YjdB